jgi:translation initiation factor IF-3|tara:strand:+ start:515 stop:892 length:378 start_codon:yes stop_codon:yes gene_type:complete
MEVQGSIKVIGEVQEISATFKKRELVVTTDEQYPQTISIEFIQDKTDLLNSFEVGQNVKVNINLRGREWENPQTKEIKYFNSIQGWRIELIEVASQKEDLPPLDNLSPFEPASDSKDEDLDDLPF